MTPLFPFVQKQIDDVLMSSHFGEMQRGLTARCFSSNLRTLLDQIRHDIPMTIN